MTGIEALAFGAIAKEVGGPASRLLGNVGRRRYDQIVAKYLNAFTDHVDWVQRKTSTIKNLIYRDQSASIFDKYVSIEFSELERNISDKAVIDKIKNGKKIVISGTGGAGKTMFMKWAAQELIRTLENHQMIPLFLELRDMSDKDIDGDLTEYLFRSTSSVKNKSTYNQFLEGIKAGIFVIILDAVDEINHVFREAAIKRIQEFAERHPNVGLLVSTRPDTRIEALPELSVIKSCPMSLGQVIHVLLKLEYDEIVTGKLIEELKSGLYEKHQSFLSNPLLATIMLLTYDHSAEIPNKVTSFYKLAFEALYQRHDATKGVYKRGHYAGLPMDEFERIFSAFCYRSYVNSRFEFSDADLIRLFRDSAKFCEINSDAGEIAKDSTESVCLMQKDGLVNVFAHRSFQEYFTAIFISLYRGEDIEQILERAVNRGHSENVVPMLYEIDKETLETKFVIPKLRHWINRVRNLHLNTVSGFTKFMASTFDSMEISVNDGRVRGYRMVYSVASHFLSKIEMIYPEAQIHLRVFDFNPIHDEFTKFFVAPPSKSGVLRAYPSQVMTEGENQFLRILPRESDSRWLIHTNVPHRMSLVRADIEGLLASLEKEYVVRNSNVSNIWAPI